MSKHYNLTKEFNSWPTIIVDNIRIKKVPFGVAWAKEGSIISIGENCFAGYGFILKGTAKIHDKFNVGDNFVAENDFYAGNNFIAGDHCYIGENFKTESNFTAGNKLSIGARFRAKRVCTFGNNCTIGNGFSVENNFKVSDNFVVRDYFTTHSSATIPKCMPLGDFYTFLHCIKMRSGLLVPIFMQRDFSNIFNGNDSVRIVAVTETKIINIADAIEIIMLQRK